jgi:hypothetical protein
MKWFGAIAIMMLALSGWGQSLGDLARANRERQQQSTQNPQVKRVFTNDDMQSGASAAMPETVEDASNDLNVLKFVLWQICTIPKLIADRSSAISTSGRCQTP